MEDKAKILAFLRQQKLAVIASYSPAQPTPESALVAFTEDGQLRIYFQTSRHSRKAANMARNPHVSLVIGLTLQDLTTVQYEGIVRQLVEPTEIEACKQLFLAKNSPTTPDYFDRPTTLLFEVSPTWIGYSDYSTNLPKVIEMQRF